VRLNVDHSRQLKHCSRAEEGLLLPTLRPRQRFCIASAGGSPERRAAEGKEKTVVEVMEGEGKGARLPLHNCLWLDASSGPEARVGERHSPLLELGSQLVDDAEVVGAWI
jgi:hypothetical protein